MMKWAGMKVAALALACLIAQDAEAAVVARRRPDLTRRRVVRLPATATSPGVGDQFSFTVPGPTGTVPPPVFTSLPIDPPFSSFTFPFASTATPTDTDTDTDTFFPTDTSSTPSTTSTSSTSSTSTTPSTTSTSSTSTTPTTTSTSTSTTSSSSSTPTPTTTSTPDPTTSSSTLFTTITPSSSALPSASLAAGNRSSSLSKGTKTGIIGGAVVGGLVALGLLLWLGTCLTRRRTDHHEVDKIAIDFDPAGHGRTGPLYRNSRRLSAGDVQKSGPARTYSSGARNRDPGVLRRPSSRRKPPPRLEDLPETDDLTPQENDPRELAEVAWEHGVSIPAPRPSLSRHGTPGSGQTGSSGGLNGARSLRNYTSRPAGDPNTYISAIPPYPPRQVSDESRPSFNSGRPSVFGRDAGYQGQQKPWQPEHRTWGSGPRPQNQSQWQGDDQGVLPEEDVYGGTTEDTLRRAMRGPSSYPTEATPGGHVV